jgi:hypothetical protein
MRTINLRNCLSSVRFLRNSLSYDRRQIVASPPPPKTPSSLVLNAKGTDDRRIFFLPFLCWVVAPKNQAMEGCRPVERYDMIWIFDEGYRRFVRSVDKWRSEGAALAHLMAVVCNIRSHLFCTCTALLSCWEEGQIFSIFRLHSTRRKPRETWLGEQRSKYCLASKLAN